LSGAQGLHAKISGFARAGSTGVTGASTHRRTTSMDIEQINAIGTRLADLSERTTALRGYL
jgi:hypothetical protein